MCFTKASFETLRFLFSSLLYTFPIFLFRLGPPVISIPLCLISYFIYRYLRLLSLSYALLCVLISSYFSLLSLILPPLLLSHYSLVLFNFPNHLVLSSQTFTMFSYNLIKRISFISLDTKRKAIGKRFRKDYLGHCLQEAVV